MQSTTPWYRQFWPWFIMALPASAVVASFATLAIALHNPDPLVRDDWYAHGSRINETLQRERTAAELGIHAALQLDESGRSVFATLAASDVPASLDLMLRHPTRAQRDITLTLQRGNDGRYVAAADHRLDGTWDATLLPTNGTWGLRSRIWLRPQAGANLGGES